MLLYIINVSIEKKVRKSEYFPEKPLTRGRFGAIIRVHKHRDLDRVG
jgi:hypothetical protein